MAYTKKKIAVLDFETNGKNPQEQDVLEIGVVIADAKSLQYLERWSTLVQPREDQQPTVHNIYDPQLFRDALSPIDAFSQLHKKIKGMTVMTYNISFDGPFLDHGLKNAGIEYDYMKLCILSMAAFYLKIHKLERSKSLKSMCQLFKIAPEPNPHRAINGAFAAHAVLKKLCENK